MKTKTKVGTTGIAAILAIVAGMASLHRPTHFAVVEYTDYWGIDGQRSTAGVHSYVECIEQIDTLSHNVFLDGGKVDEVDCVDVDGNSVTQESEKEA